MFIATQKLKEAKYSCSLESSQLVQLCQHLDFRLLDCILDWDLSDLWQNTFVFFFLNHPVCYSSQVENEYICHLDSAFYQVRFLFQILWFFNSKIYIWFYLIAASQIYFPFECLPLLWNMIILATLRFLISPTSGLFIAGICWLSFSSNFPPNFPASWYVG